MTRLCFIALLAAVCLLASACAPRPLHGLAQDLGFTGDDGAPGRPGTVGIPGSTGPAGQPSSGAEALYYVCHIPSGKHSKRYNLFAPTAAIPALFAGGDYYGECL